MAGRNSYVTRAEAIEREIRIPIELNKLSEEDFDIDAIADDVLGDYEMGYACLVEEWEFWEIVNKHAF